MKSDTLPKILKIMACTAGPAAIVTLGATALGAYGRASGFGTSVFWRLLLAELTGIALLVMTVLTVTSAILLGLALFIRRMGPPLWAGFAIAAGLLVLIQAITIFAAQPFLLNVVVTVVQTMAVATFQRLLLHDKPRTAPEAVF